MDCLKNFFKTIFVYFIGNVASRLVSFILLPLYTGLVSDAEFGYHDLAINLMTIVVSVLCIDVWTGIMRFMFDFKNIRDKRRVISTGTAMGIFSFLIFTAGYLITCQFIEIQYPFIVYLFGAGYIYYEITSYVARGLGKNFVYVSAGLIGTVIAAVTNIVLLVFFDWQADALILATGLSYLIPAIYIDLRVGVLRRFRLSQVSPKLMRAMYRYCLPLSINSVSFWINSGFNRIVITQQLGSAANGQYAVANKFTTIILLIVSVFNLAWQEAAFSMTNENDRGKKYTFILKYYNRFIGCGVLLLLPVTTFLFPIMVRGDYDAARAIIPVSYLATFANTLSSFLGNIMCAEKATMTTFTSNILGGVVSIASIYLLIGKFGLQAAAISMLLGFVVIVIFRFFSIQKSVPIRFDISFFVPYALMFILSSYIFYSRSIVANILLFLGLICYSIFILRNLIRMLLIRMIHLYEKQKRPHPGHSRH
ncbi:MAG TPA: lipopolysaccharide biosynthesis protein [Firmicutes bacterium]|nr:lipopolysaccharide biosynthesis protein [Bacillota bacterium]